MKGPGLLTRSILDADARKVVVIEKDERFLPALNQLASSSNGRLVVIHGDILTIPHQQILDHYHTEARKQSFVKSHFVGNLPFGISTILIVRWIELMNSGQGIFSLDNIEMTLMFQVDLNNAYSPVERSRRRYLCHSTSKITI